MRGTSRPHHNTPARSNLMHHFIAAIWSRIRQVYDWASHAQRTIMVTRMLCCGYRVTWHLL